MVEPQRWETRTFLERLDVALAARFVPRTRDLSLAAQPEEIGRVAAGSGVPQRVTAPMISGLLGLRGLDLRLPDVQAILHGRGGRYRPSSQEYVLVRGTSKGLRMMLQRAASRELPDGDLAVRLFRALAGPLPRFRNNWLRRDMPWDGMLYVSYPDAAEVPHLLAEFDPAHRYRDVALRFDRIHPVRQAFRVLWKLARISPFPDFNLVVAHLVMNCYLLGMGYPALPVELGDRELWTRIVSGPPPVRMHEFEARLLATVM